MVPTVKIGTTRSRFNMNANHTRDQIDRLLDIIAHQIKNKWR